MYSFLAVLKYFVAENDKDVFIDSIDDAEPLESPMKFSDFS